MELNIAWAKERYKELEVVKKQLTNRNFFIIRAVGVCDGEGNNCFKIYQKEEVRGSKINLNNPYCFLTDYIRDKSIRVFLTEKERNKKYEELEKK